MSSSPPALRETAPRPLVSSFVVYVVGGGLATLIHLSTLYLLVEYAHAAPTLATSVGFVVGTAFNYTFQYHFTFASNAPHGRTLVRYLAVALVMLGLNALLFRQMTMHLGVPYLIAQITATGLVMLCNFTINRTYTFRRA